MSNFKNPETIMIAHHEYGYANRGASGVQADGKLVFAPSLADLTITSDTRVVDLPEVKNAPAAPDKVYCDYTLRCGLSCGFCLNGIPSVRESRQKIPQLSRAQVRIINGQIIDSGTLSAKLSGGEPFDYDGFWDSVDVLGQAGLALSASTSGYPIAHLSQDQIKLLIKNRVKVSFSLDGPEERHDNIRGKKGLYRMVFDGVERLKSEGMDKTKIEFRGTLLSDGSAHNVLEFLDAISRESGAKVRLRLARHYGDAAKNGVAVLNHNADVSGLLKELRLRKKVNPLLNIDPFLNFDEEPDIKTGSDCGAGTRSVWVNADGDTMPCGAIAQYFPEKHNLLDGTHTLASAWQSGGAFLAVRKYFESENKNSRCAKCSFHDACQSGCPSVTLGAGVAHYPLCPVDLGLDKC